MVAAWHICMKFLLVAGLVVGCNSLMPGFAAASTPPALSHNESCHHPDQKSDASVVACKASCLAITPDVAELGAFPRPKAPLQPTPPRTLANQTIPPDAPPPRS